MDQPFTLPKDKRQTPVQMAFNKLDDMKVEVSWPAGWIVDSSPDPVSFEGPAGRFITQIAVEEASKFLTYQRVFERSRTEFVGDDYASIQDLYEKASKNDAQQFVWVQE